MKYVIYCRKSTDSEDKQVLSLDAQERELLDIAQKNNLTIAKTFRESMSAKSFGRPLFNEMLNFIESGKADGILCWKLDRLARNFIDGGKIIDSLQKSIIKEIRTYESVHLPNETVFLLAMQFGMANQYSRDLSVNVKRGNREKLSRGEWPGPAPFGYLNDKVNKTIIIDPILSKYVRKMYELYSTGGYTISDISRILYSDGLRTKTGKKVFKSLIHRTLKNPFYTGIMVREGKFYQGNHEKIISKQIFDNVQNLLNNSSRPRPKALFFPLRGFLKCESCGCSLTSSIKKGHHYYYCTNGKGSCNEHKKYLRENYLYELISNILKNTAFTERKIELMYEAAKERLNLDSEYITKSLDTLKNSLEGLKTRESRLVDTFITEQINKDLYDQKILQLNNEKTVILSQIKELELKQPSSTLEPTKNVFLQVNRASKEFLFADDYKKREIVKELLWNLSIKDKNMVTVSLKSPFNIMYKSPKNGDIFTLLGDRDSNPDLQDQNLTSYH